MLSYLEPFKKNINWSALTELAKEREAWWKRESAKRWLIEDYPKYKVHNVDLSKDWVTIEGSPRDNTQKELLAECAHKLIPWKKGPFELFEHKIDAEWRSDYKWSRLEPFLPNLENKVLLDIGCNNGYFLFRMAAQNPRLALGIDPVLPMQAQFDFIQNYVQAKNTHFELWGVEHLNLFKEMYDVIFHMGIIYHHRHPIMQLLDMREALKPGGIAFIETIGIPGQESIALFPEDRYARMGNVWFVPTLTCLINWAAKARFINIEVVADTELNNEEQRVTKWCPDNYKSLDDSLDQSDPNLTIEGHPAPRRFLIKVQKKGAK